MTCSTFAAGKARLNPKELGDWFEELVAEAFCGTVEDMREYDVIASGKHIECKSRSRGCATRTSDKNQFRIGIYPKYFEGDTHGMAFGYFDGEDKLEAAYLLPINVLKSHFDSSATPYHGNLRWRPSRKHIEAIRERRDITAIVKRAEKELS